MQLKRDKYVKFNTIFKSPILWSITLYKEKFNFLFDSRLANNIKTFNQKKIRTKLHYAGTLADPFLFVDNDSLYLFYESKCHGRLGKIHLTKTTDLENYEDLGCVLDEDFHLSYPFVFKDNSSIYMIPETANANEVLLFKFQEFPLKLKKHKTLLTGCYWDSSIIQHDNLWYLFTSSNKGLEIFYTKELENEELVPHPQNPIATDSRYERCGGGPIKIDDVFFRIAQDCSNEYGKNIHIFKIKELSQTKYEEELFKENYFELDQNWNSMGGHHFNIVNFKGDKVIATDGKQRDYLFNKILTVSSRYL
ncbi:MAG: hypothetical protein ACJA2M_001936 [Polaribacter sp.]|jgi:hypothetical protein